MVTTAKFPGRQFRCRLEEVAPLARLAHGQYQKYRPDFLEVSTDFGAAFDTDYEAKLAAFEQLVPTRQRIVSAAEQNRRLNKAAKALRHPLNLLEIQIGSASRAKSLTVAAKDMGLARVRAGINSRDMQGLDDALGALIGLVEVNKAALTARGMKPQALLDLRAARTTLGVSNTTHDGNRLDQPELTEANIQAGNDLWNLMAEILRVGRLLYKESNKQRAASFTLARLKKLMRSANEGGAKDVDEPDSGRVGNG